MKDTIYSWPIQLEARKQAEEERKAAAAEAAEARNQAAAGAQAKKQAQVSAIIHDPPSHISHFMPHRYMFINTHLSLKQESKPRKNARQLLSRSAWKLNNARLSWQQRSKLR